MSELRNNKSSSNVNNQSSFTNQNDGLREPKSKNLSMQQSLSKRLVMFQQEQRNTLKEYNNMIGGNTISSNQNNSTVTKQATTKQQKYEIEGKYNTSNVGQNQIISNQNIESEANKKGIFEEYQERWKQNNKKIFRYLITWKVGDDGKIEDQLKLMISYLSLIFLVILFICGFATTYYFHQTNKENIQQSIESQAKTILENSLSQYKNSTEYIFKGYEFVLNYLNDLILSKLEISHKVYNYNYIKQFPYKGPNKMHKKGEIDVNESLCPIYKGNFFLQNQKVKFDIIDISLKCIDWFEYDVQTKPLQNENVYQDEIDTNKLNGAIDILNYILENQMFDIFITKIQKIYFAFEYRQAMYSFPGLNMGKLTDDYRPHGRSWYSNTRQHHIDQQNSQVFRVMTTPYYDLGTNSRVVTISKAILAPAKNDTEKRYLTGKGRFMGVSNIDIRIGEFQELFQQIKFYDTGYLLIVNNQGKLLNEPSQFINQIQKKNSTQELEILQLISQSDWEQIRGSNESQLLQVITSNFGEQLVITSTINKEDYYKNEEIIILLVIPYSEVYGEIESQNDLNLKNIIISSVVSMAVFIFATIICMIFVKKRIVNMVSAITELNKCALSLTSSNSITNSDSQSNTNSKKEVMEKLNQIEKNSQSQTIKELVEGFQNQLKGISKLGKGGQNILKNGKSTLKYEQAEYGGTQLPSYVEPLLNYLNIKKEKLDNEPSFSLSQYSSISQVPPKSLTNQYKKQFNGSFMYGTPKHSLQQKNYHTMEDHLSNYQQDTYNHNPSNNITDGYENNPNDANISRQNSDKYTTQTNDKKNILKKQFNTNNGVNINNGVNNNNGVNIQNGVHINNINSGIMSGVNLNGDIQDKLNNMSQLTDKNNIFSHNQLLSTTNKDNDNNQFFSLLKKNQENGISPLEIENKGQLAQKINKQGDDNLIEFDQNDNDTIDLDYINSPSPYKENTK